MTRPTCLRRLLLLVLLAAHLSASKAGELNVRWDAPPLDRWMYPFNATPGTRPRAPVLGTLYDDAGVDSLHGQFILAFDTTNQVTAGRPTSSAARCSRRPWRWATPLCSIRPPTCLAVTSQQTTPPTCPTTTRGGR